MKSIHDLIGMPLVTIGEGTRLGTLQGVEVDTSEGRIRYLHFDGAETRADGVLPWESVGAVGDDVITIDSLASVQEAVPAGDRDKVTPLVGDRPVVTEGGDRLGQVTDYDVDETNGRIERFHLATGGWFGRLVHRELTFTFDAIRVLGHDAIIVADEVTGSALSTVDNS